MRAMVAAPMLALVDASGQNLYLAAANADSAPPVYSAPGITSLSWDAFGHLWFVAAPNGMPELLRVDTTANPIQAQPVTVELPTGATPGVQQVAVAPDGHRLALVYKVGDDFGLSIGVELATGTAGSPASYISLADDSSLPILDGWATLSDVEWNSGQTLAVLGAQESAEAPSVSELYTDGSPVFTHPDLNTVSIVPPISTSSIAWNTSGWLVAAYQGTADTPQIATYSPSNDTWETDSVFSGISPSYGG